VFIQVDSYRNPEQEALFQEWVLTGKAHGYLGGWIGLFKGAGYTGLFAQTEQ
jgi:hypothetical protein